MKQYKQALIITLISGILLFIANAMIGKNELFLLLNTDGGQLADSFFHYYTFLGDGIFWVPVVVLVYFFKREYLILIIAAIVFSTLFTHVFKDWLMQAEPRPTRAITDASIIHFVQGVELHSIGSFPSGHTTTAFCFYLLACLFFYRKWVLPIGFLLALLVGYSRVYLAQHFPKDVAGGMIAAVTTMIISLQMQLWWAYWRKSRLKKKSC